MHQGNMLSRGPQDGAGISTSAGIPDIQSPNTGLYARLARLNLPPSPFMEAVFHISYFRVNPKPFYSLIRELYTGLFQPTIAHCFIRLLSDKGLLLKLFEQNNDRLSVLAGVPVDKIVEGHGSYADQHCIDCKSSYPSAKMRQAILGREIPRCEQCHGFVKPDIMMYGDELPTAFTQNEMLPAESDLCIVMGTSLTAGNFACLPERCPQGVPRLLINQEHVKTLGSRADDVVLLGDCDDGVRRLAAALGWEAELQALWYELTRTEGGRKIGSEEQVTSWDADQMVAEITSDVDFSIDVQDEELKALMQRWQEQTSLAA